MTAEESHTLREAHLRGTELAPPSRTTVPCNSCGKTLGESAPLTAYLIHSLTETGVTHRTVACYCLRCAPISFRSEWAAEIRAGTHHLLVEGRLGIAQDSSTQETWPILVAPTLIAQLRRSHSDESDQMHESRQDAAVRIERDETKEPEVERR